MGRILAIDYGTKRIGIAVTDPLKIIAGALTTVSSKDIFSFLEKYFKEENVECIVVGDPSMGGKNIKISKLADDFCNTLKRKFKSKKIERLQEFYSSKMAFQTMIDSGLKKKERRNKETIDKISAAIILQDFLNHKLKER